MYCSRIRRASGLPGQRPWYLLNIPSHLSKTRMSQDEIVMIKLKKHEVYFDNLKDGAQNIHDMLKAEVIG